MKTKTRTSILLVALLSCMTACSKPAVPSNAKTTVTLQQEWFPFAGFAGEVSAAKRFAPDLGVNLTILAGSEQVDPIKLVLSGTADVGVVSGDLLAAAIAKGAPLVAIGVVNEQSPTVFLVRDKSEIRTPKDFVGKKVGLLPGTNTERIYDLLMKRQGIDRKGVTELPIPFDLQTFLLEQYDVRPAFVYDEPVSLEQNGVSFRVINPKEYGVDFIGTVYFTSKATLDAKRPLIVKLLQSLIRGWQFALKEPDRSIEDLVQSYPTLKAMREKRALELGAKYFVGSGGKPLSCSPDTWDKMLRGLEELNVIPSGTLNVSQIWEPGPLQEAYHHEGS